MTRITKMIEGIRVWCPGCKKAVTPILRVVNDDQSDETQSIDCDCPTCGQFLKVFK